MQQQEKNFLQSIKLEISRSFKLAPYERISFHRILGILRTETGQNILLNELERGPDIRQSAISILSKFNTVEVTQRLKSLLGKKISPSEVMHILNHLEEFGTTDDIQDIITFLNRLEESENSPHITGKAFSVLKKIGSGTDEVLNYLLAVINSENPNRFLQEQAILSLSSFRIVSSFEEILNRKDDRLCYFVYRSLYDLNSRLIDTMRAEATETDGIAFSYSDTGSEDDKLVLDVRVLLGKMSSRFDEYSNLTKIAFISSMISCNHREFLIYVMKALTSRDPELISMTLYALISNIEKLRDPDKLFRSLIALSTESERDNELIVEIFIKFFTGIGENRKHHILKDKLYSYIVVTLETYFESYRRDFMIKDVVEKSFPESFQQVRNFILERLTPEHKKRIITFLSSEDSRSTHKLLQDISNWVAHVNEEEQEQLYNLMEIMFDEDQKSRENSAGRLEDINHEITWQEQNSKGFRAELSKDPAFPPRATTVKRTDPFVYNTVFTNLGEGTYYIQVKALNSDGLTEPSGKVMINMLTTSVGDPKASEICYIYTDRQGQVHLIINVQNTTTAHVDIYSVSGVMLQTKSYSLISENNDILLDLNQWPDGVYMLKVSSENFYRTIKIKK